MIKSAAKATTEPAGRLAAALSTRMDRASGTAPDGKVYFESASTMKASVLAMIGMAGRVYVALPPGWVVVVWADSRESAHAEVLRQLTLAGEQQS